MRHFKSVIFGAAALGFVGNSALGADLPARVYTKAPMVPPVLEYNWTGCYVGGNGGGLWANKSWTVPTTGALYTNHTARGGMGGVQIGCNYETPSRWVIGIQGDYDFVSATGSSPDLLSLFPLTDQSRISGLGSVTGRVGYAWNRFLGYVKGGGAWERDRYNTYFGPLTTTPGAPFSTASETRPGWTLGVGGEYAFTQNLTGFLEYDYYDFGTRTNTFTTTGGGSVLTNIRERKNIVKAGLNWKFDWPGTVVARY
jgi:outer membrane immunogenic protein